MYKKQKQLNFWLFLVSVSTKRITYGLLQSELRKKSKEEDEYEGDFTQVVFKAQKKTKDKRKQPTALLEDHLPEVTAFSFLWDVAKVNIRRFVETTDCGASITGRAATRGKPSMHCRTAENAELRKECHNLHRWTQRLGDH